MPAPVRQGGHAAGSCDPGRTSTSTTAAEPSIGGPTYTGGPYPADYQGRRLLRRLRPGLRQEAEATARAGTSVENFATDWSGVDLEMTPGGELAYVGHRRGRGPPNRLHAAQRQPDRTPRRHAHLGTGAARRELQRQPVERPRRRPAQLLVGLRRRRARAAQADAQPPLRQPWHLHSAADSERRPRRHQHDTADDLGGEHASGAPGQRRHHLPRRRAFELQASATDAQDQPFPGSRVSWDVRVIHGTHEHFSGHRFGSDPRADALTDHDADSFYRIVVTATDSGGLTGHRDRRTAAARPRPCPSAQQPLGRAARLRAGRSLTAPRDLVTAIGFRTSVSANSPFQLGGAIFDFSSWSNGGAQIQSFTVPASGAELVANYRRRGGAPATPPRLLRPRRPRRSRRPTPPAPSSSSSASTRPAGASAVARPTSPAWSRSRSRSAGASRTAAAAGGSSASAG